MTAATSAARRVPVRIPFQTITPEQRATFLRDGFLVLPDLIPRSVALSLASRYDGLFRGDFETGTYPDEWYGREGMSLPLCVKEICNGWKSDRLVASVALSAGLGKLATDLMGWESGARIGQDDVLHKPPGGSEVAFHQDSAYISRQFVPPDDNSVTIWCALDDVDPSTGSVEYVPGSHRWQQRESSVSGSSSGSSSSSGGSSSSSSLDMQTSTFHSGGGAGGDGYRSAMFEAAEACGIAREDVPPVQSITVQAGGAVVHHQDVWHGSDRNRTADRPRRALGVHLLRSDVQFRGGDALLGDGTEGPTYIYGRYKELGSADVPEKHFPVTFGPGRSEFLDDYCTVAA